MRTRTTPAEYQPPTPIPGSDLVKLGVGVELETHRKLWHLARLLNTGMGPALNRLIETIDPEAGIVPPELTQAAAAAPRQLPLSA